MKKLRLARKLLSFNNAKTIKGESLGFRTAILYLAPSFLSGVMDTCPHSSKQCRATCLYHSGRSLMFPKINEARVSKTKLFYAHPDLFWEVLQNELDDHRNYCLKRGLKPAFRFNGTSDIYNAELQNFMWQNQDVDFYDYTKDFELIKKYIGRKLAHNYSLTFSYSENNFDESIFCLNNGVNVAVVFAVKRGHKLPSTWNGFQVIDGDTHDLRFLDSIKGYQEKKAFVIGLRAKGHARKLKPSRVGFVQPNMNT